MFCAVYGVFPGSPWWLAKVMHGAGVEQAAFVGTCAAQAGRHGSGGHTRALPRLKEDSSDPDSIRCCPWALCSRDVWDTLGSVCDEIDGFALPGRGFFNIETRRSFLFGQESFKSGVYG